MTPRQDRVDKGMYWDEALTLVSGCDPVSEGCQNCWALRKERQYTRKGTMYDPTVRLHLAALKKLRRKKPTVFSVWNDLFHPRVGMEFIDTAMRAIQYAPQHRVLVLTKRSNRMMNYWRNLASVCHNHPWLTMNNLWLGVTVESAAHVDRIDALRKTPAAHRFVSFEPLLGDIPNLDLRGIDWVIVGAETGPGRRYCDPAWIQSIVDQADAANMPVFVKAIQVIGRNSLNKVSKDMSGWPPSLRRREWPK